MKFLLLMLLISQSVIADDGMIVASEDTTIEYPASDGAVEDIPADSTYTPTVDSSSSEDDSWGD